MSKLDLLTFMDIVKRNLLKKTANKISNDFERYFFPQILTLSKTRELIMDFDYTKEFVIGRFEIAGYLWRRFWEDVSKVKTDLMHTKTEISFTNNASQDWGDISAKKLSKVKFSKAKYRVSMENMSYIQ
mmetsp:Transcript_5015/g.5713  ORF Transcript_5015/g.5713 Transcript_5015/m.5713 type:complete len:129 (-) Transcript_5015:67-453(-)